VNWPETWRLILKPHGYQKLPAHFCTALNRPYNREDVERIARLQVEEEEKKEKEANEILFCDTTLLVVKIWMENAFGSCPDWILESVEIRKYDLYLLPDIDLPWQPDPLREHPNQREFFLNWYVRELNRMKVNWKLISGNGIFRLKGCHSPGGIGVFVTLELEI
jgi:nicotinamide riboside kinase